MRARNVSELLPKPLEPVTSHHQTHWLPVIHLSSPTISTGHNHNLSPSLTDADMAMSSAAPVVSDPAITAPVRHRTTRVCFFFLPLTRVHFRIEPNGSDGFLFIFATSNPSQRVPRHGFICSSSRSSVSARFSYLNFILIIFVHNRPSTPLSRTNSDDWAARYAPADPAPPPAPTPRHKRPVTTTQRHTGRVIPTIITTAPTPVARKSRKRLQLDSDDECDIRQNGKRTRIEGREMIDGDEDATWFKSMPVVRKSVKRSASPGAEGSDSRPFPKRGKKSNQAEHDTLDPNAASRGRKRPRNSNVAEDERQSDDQRGNDKKKKGRMVSEVNETPSTQDETLVSDSEEQGEEMDVNLDQDESGPTTLDDDELDYDSDTLRSTDPLCGGRKIGEEWESGGREYKVGPTGNRLRKAFVRESRRKYNMVCSTFYHQSNH